MKGELRRRSWETAANPISKVGDIPKSGLNNGLNGVVNLSGCLGAKGEGGYERGGKHRQTGDTHRRGSGARIGRPVTTSARSETDANTVSGIVLQS